MSSDPQIWHRELLQAVRTFRHHGLEEEKLDFECFSPDHNALKVASQIVRDLPDKIFMAWFKDFTKFDFEIRNNDFEDHDKAL